jgi:hypothetical protein
MSGDRKKNRMDVQIGKVMERELLNFFLSS